MKSVFVLVCGLELCSKVVFTISPERQNLGDEMIRDIEVPSTSEGFFVPGLQLFWINLVKVSGGSRSGVNL